MNSPSSTTTQEASGMSLVLNKIFPHHAQILLKNGVLFYDDDWNLMQQQPSSSSLNNHQPPPRYCIAYLSPNNFNLKLFCQSNLLRSNESSNNINNADSSWFDQMMKQIEQSKESLEEYYQYLSEFEIKTFLKMNDRNVYERWSQYANAIHLNQDTPNDNSPSFFVLHLQVYDDSTRSYDPASLIGMCIKSVLLNGKPENIGFDGSGWLHKKYRGNILMKGSLWYLHLLIHRQMGVRFSYGHVFEGNVKSFKSIIKSGMIPTKLSLSYIGITLNELVAERNNSIVREAAWNGTTCEQTFQKVETYREYEDLMKSVFHNHGLLLKNLKSYFDNQYFLGCFQNKYLTFQLWKGQYSKDMKSGQVMPTFLVFNVKCMSSCSASSLMEHFDNMVHQLSTIIPQLLTSTAESHYSSAFVVFATAGGQFLEYLLTHYSKASSISSARLRYVLQDIDLFFQHTKGLRSNNDQEIQDFFTKKTHSDPSSLFIDIRDCASKPLIWLPKWSEDPRRLMLNEIDNTSRVSCL
ncbi:hypothetical protein C9374_013716 [Naegleria lovaniensis]|uniref:Uncharacterized protein n=1 Tax=Naegleria lovaniensis TaxID=51637 RepID=A0AA88KAU5_NAELO|nr:uncharacterized protein C9374_013716 [Naegleria lovaniensis]KAG2370916.1 hypothetical protein C9374_013716 [Naegleria lovaniensis]